MAAPKKRNTKRIKKTLNKTNMGMRRKLVILFVIVLLALAGLVARLTFINASNGTKYKKQVLSQAQSSYASTTLPAKRGDIYDRNGNILATSNKVYNVILDCKAVNSDEDYIEPTVKALRDILGIDEETVRTKLTSEATKESQYQIIKRQLSMDDKKAFDAYVSTKDENLTTEQIKEKNRIQGVWFEEDYLRTYPYNETACDTIGFTFSRDVADWGLEGYYNSTLTGSDGRRYGYFNSDSDVEQTIIDPSDGNSIETTIDIGAQQIVEKWVNAFNEVLGGKNVGVIVEDPSNGEILAMDGGDRYDLNNPRDLSGVYSEDQIKAMNDETTVEALNAMWNNFCVTDAYEPGSVVKPIVMSAALEKGKIDSSDTFECDGFQMFDTTMIKCAAYPSAHGTETLGEVIANSCNDGMMQIGYKMGAEQFIKTQSLFNFGTRTGIDLPNEGTGIIHSTQTMGSTELACSAFGQGFTCTMIQEINAMCSVVNGGYYYQPHLVTKIKDASGGVIKNYSPVLLKQTISSAISEEIRSYMQLSVQQGTSRYTKVQGYSSGGKTGTAEKLPRGNGKYLVSFIGFAPVSAPRIVLYVVVDEPHAEEQADSKYAQYIAQAILSELLPYYNVEPDEAVNGYVEETTLWQGFNGHVKNNVEAQLDANGNLVNEDGYRIDWDGNRIDENGYLLDDQGNYKYDDNGDMIKSENLLGVGTTTDGDLPEGISDTSVPSPLDDDSDPIVGNDMESEGVTNEEAGFE